MDQQRIGGLCLETAPPLKTLYENYCSNHPFAAHVLTEKKYLSSVFLHLFLTTQFMI